MMLTSTEFYIFFKLRILGLVGIGASLNQQCIAQISLTIILCKMFYNQ